MPKKKQEVAVFLGNSSNESEVQEYADANGLKILYTFNKKTSSASVSPGLIRQGLREFGAVLKGKRRFNSLFMGTMKRIGESINHLERRRPFNNRPFMTMVEYVTQYKQCQGLLVYDIKDISPRDPSVARWVIDKFRAKNKEVYSVVPYVYESLPQWKDSLQSNFDGKWSELIEACDFNYNRCPPIVSICVFENQCFFKCRFCYQVKNPEVVIEEYMDFDLLKKIIEDIPPDEHLLITLGPGGEPLTYPKIHEMVRYVTDTRPLAATEYSTNGILMNQENAIKVIESGLTSIEVSLNAPTREDYEWFTGIDGYDRVVSNMIGLMKLRSKLGSTTPFVKTKIMGLKRWANKTEDSIQYLNSIIDEARVSPVSYYQDEELENIDSLKLSTNPLVPTCPYLTGNMLIMPNGRYQLCCAPDFIGKKYGPVDLGNARDKNLIDVWCGEKYVKLRKINARGQPIFANCLTCNIANPDFGSDLIVKAKQRKLLGLDK
ncbi:radical SAM/SPASM domain-containing protein [Chloroflexota bacterium]